MRIKRQRLHSFRISTGTGRTLLFLALFAFGAGCGQHKPPAAVPGAAAASGGITPANVDAAVQGVEQNPSIPADQKQRIINGLHAQAAVSAQH